MLPPPLLPDESFTKFSYQSWIGREGLVMIHNYSSVKRVIRCTQKIEDGERLMSRLTFQERDCENSLWRDLVRTKVFARRVPQC